MHTIARYAAHDVLRVVSQVYVACIVFKFSRHNYVRVYVHTHMRKKGFHCRNQIAAATAYSMRKQTNFVTATNLFDITTKSIFCL